MSSFTPEEIEAIDALWRALPAGHMWTGWAASGEAPDRVWIFRTRAHWRRFALTKTASGYALADERGRNAAEAADLPGLLKAVEAIPGLEQLFQE